MWRSRLRFEGVIVDEPHCAPPAAPIGIADHRQSDYMEVVDPDPNVPVRLHAVSISGSAARFCKERHELCGDSYFRKMLRGEQDEHKLGWMLRTTVSGRWIKHVATGEYVAVVGKVKDFVKNVARKRPAGNPFLDDGNALAKLLAGTYSSHGNPSNILDKWEKVPEPFDVMSKLNKSSSSHDSPSSLPDFAAPPPTPRTGLGAQFRMPLRAATTLAAAVSAANGGIPTPAALGSTAPMQVVAGRAQLSCGRAGRIGRQRHGGKGHAERRGRCDRPGRCADVPPGHCQAGQGRCGQ